MVLPKVVCDALADAFDERLVVGVCDAGTTGELFKLGLFGPDVCAEDVDIVTVEAEADAESDVAGVVEAVAFVVREELGAVAVLVVVSEA